MASWDALSVEPNRPTRRPCRHGEWQTDSLGARRRGHVRIPCRGATGCNDAGYKLPVPGPAGFKTKSYFLGVRRRYLEQRASLSGGILLAGYQIRTYASFAGGMEICQRAGREIADRQPGSIQRHAAEYANRLAALCGRQLQAFRPVHWAGQPGVSRYLRRQTWRSRNHCGRIAISQEPRDRGAEAFQFASL